MCPTGSSTSKGGNKQEGTRRRSASNRRPSRDTRPRQHKGDAKRSRDASSNTPARQNAKRPCPSRPEKPRMVHKGTQFPVDGEGHTVSVNPDRWAPCRYRDTASQAWEDEAGRQHMCVLLGEARLRRPRDAFCKEEEEGTERLKGDAVAPPVVHTQIVVLPHDNLRPPPMNSIWEPVQQVMSDVWDAVPAAADLPAPMLPGPPPPQPQGQGSPPPTAGIAEGGNQAPCGLDDDVMDVVMEDPEDILLVDVDQQDDGEALGHIRDLCDQLDGL